MSKRRVVFGCGSQARYVIDNLRSRGQREVFGLVDIEGGAQVGKSVSGVEVRWDRSRALAELDSDSCEVIVAHGNAGLKRALVSELSSLGFAFFSAIHDRAIVSGSASVAAGCIVNPGAVLLPDSRLEAHVIVHSGAVVEHDCLLEEGCNIAPGVSLAGRVRVGPDAVLYTGCCVIPGRQIGARAVVGAGAVVVRDVPAEACVVGNPARSIQRK